MFKIIVMKGGYPPKKAYTGDAGFDLFSSSYFFIPPSNRIKIGLKLKIEMPDGYVAMIQDKSSIAERGVFCTGNIIDATYRGEINVILNNLLAVPFPIYYGQKIAQLLILPCYTGTNFEIVNKLSESERGDRGFGSTGKW